MIIFIQSGFANPILHSFGFGKPVELAKVQKGTISEFIQEQGKTRLPRTYILTMPFSGQLEPIALDVREVVTAGQPVAQVTQEDLLVDVEEAKAVVDRLDAAIAENDNTNVELTGRLQADFFVQAMEETVEAAKENMTAAKKRLDYSENFLANLRHLKDQGAGTQDEIDKADVAYVQSSVDYRTDVLTWQSVTAIKAATDLLPKMISQFIENKKLTRTVLEKQKAEALARLSQAQTRLKRGTIRSPVDGLVLERFVDNRQFLSGGEPLLTIGRLEDLEVESDILTQKAGQIRPGAYVELSGSAIGYLETDGDNSERSIVAGQVQRVDPAGFTKISSLGVEQQRVKVIISFDSNDLAHLLETTSLGAGYRVSVRIFLRKKEDALVIPRSAIFQGSDNSWQVFIAKNGIASRRTVKIGLQNEVSAEITEGLSVGDEVILAPESSLTEGDLVQGN
ncbi:MAG: efflux RND transporter periplasmic adaptor subunit [Pirellulaceae bacterium]|nr:efflux RND transporter periplasmic adaptor subunit [Pirellulaceae bacterium]